MDKYGSITVITGPMRSGKSEEMLRLVKRFRIAGKYVLIFKPDKDNRFDEGNTVSRDLRTEPCVVVPASSPGYINAHIDDSVDVVAIEEAQFFETIASGDKDIVSVAQELCDKGIHVLIAGLDMDTDRKPFGKMPELLAVATEVVKLQSVCEGCHEEPGVYSYREGKTEQVLVGDEGYEALCGKCYTARQRKNY